MAGTGATVVSGAVVVVSGESEAGAVVVVAVSDDPGATVVVVVTGAGAVVCGDAEASTDTSVSRLIMSSRS